MTKKEFIEFVKHQTNIELPNDETDMFNQKKKILYTKIDRKNQRDVFNLLARHNIRYENHVYDYYWIYL